MEWIDSLHWEGILIGICTFLIIGLFHPIVVKAEYYWGTRCWWIFLLLGIAGLIGSVLVSQDSAVDPVGSFLILFFLDHQRRSSKQTRTRAERLFNDESERKKNMNSKSYSK